MKKPDRAEAICFMQGVAWCVQIMKQAATSARTHHDEDAAKVLETVASEFAPEFAQAAAQELYPEYAPLSASTKRPNLGY